MKNRMRRTHGILAVSAALLAPVHAGAPIRVYVLAGQSNMQGSADISTARHMAADPQAKGLHDKLIHPDGTPKAFEQIRIAAFSQGLGGRETEKSGALSFGYGSDLSKQHVCGPELAFGVTMHEAVDEPILIIKTSWGGKSLFGDFRPPSAGGYQGAEDPEATGHFFRLMAKHVKGVLANPGGYHPDYNEVDGYTIAGFVWFQGWNDMVNRQVYPNRDAKGGYDDYTKVLELFITDVRREFGSPDMPFVIGVLGVGGPTQLYTSKRYQSVHQNFRDAMAAPAGMHSLKGVRAVLTENFWPHDVEDAANEAREFREAADVALEEERKRNENLRGRTAFQWKEDYARKMREEHMTEAERLALTGKSNQGFHYLGCLKFFAQAGEAFANAVEACR